MDILITGAGGRIGSELAALLADDGHQLRVLGLAGDPALSGLSTSVGARAFEGDITHPAGLVDAVSGVDAICHLAAALTTHDADDDTFVDVNLKGTYNLLASARRHAPGIRRFVYTSSDAVYWPAMANRPLYLPVDESHPLLAGSVYGATKVGAEALCRAFHRSYGIPYAVMRPTATVAPVELVDANTPFGRRWFLRAAIARMEGSGSGSDVDLELLEKLRAVDDGTEKLFVLTDPDGVSSLTMLTHPRDVARGMRAMIDSPEAIGEAFNIGPEGPHTERELVAELGRRLSLEVVEILHSGVRPSWYVSSAKARGVLGYRPEYSVFDLVDLALDGGQP